MGVVEKYHPLVCAVVLGAIYYLGTNDPEAYGKFLRLSYEVKDTPGKFMNGQDDYAFVVTMVFLLTILRWVLQQYFFHPLAKALGIKDRVTVTKFGESGWYCLYFMLMWPYELWISYGTDYFWDFKNMWIGYPHLPMDFHLKMMYSMQLAYWMHCMFVLFIERKRKDFAQMLAHHIVTITLISFSLRMNFARCGAIVLLEQDLGDTIFYFIKLVKYADFGEWITTPLFVLWGVSWFLTRHVVYFFILKSIYYDMPEYLPVEWNPELGLFNGPYTRIGFLIFLGILQALLLWWFTILVKVALRMMGGSEVRDDLSDEDNEQLRAELQAKDDKKNKKDEKKEK